MEAAGIESARFLPNAASSGRTSPRTEHLLRLATAVEVLQSHDQPIVKPCNGEHAPVVIRRGEGNEHAIIVRFDFRLMLKQLGFSSYPMLENLPGLRSTSSAWLVGPPEMPAPHATPVNALMHD